MRQTAEHRPNDGGLSAAAFADNGQHFPVLESEVHTVHHFRAFVCDFEPSHLN